MTDWVEMIVISAVIGVPDKAKLLLGLVNSGYILLLFCC